MSDALALPPRPNIEQYKKLAKDFQQACQTGDAGAVREWAARWTETLARLRGLPDTPEVRTGIHQDVERIHRQWQRLQKSNEHVGRCTLAGAQFLIAQCHGFDSWPKFTKHLEEIQRANSPVSQFEAAVDAIVGGDIAALGEMIRRDPELVRARSTREHRSTLLHYVSANGVEDFRQKTPPNIVEIAKLLLDSGADVNAESEAYGGRSTALGLTATSYHPEAAGVQLPLLDLLLQRGATIDGPDAGSAVNACLHNGRGEASEFLANRGARLDLEAAAGVGRLEVVKSFFDETGLKPTATRRQLDDGFTWACEFGRNQVIEYLLAHGMKVDAKLSGGETGLHWAAYEGHADTVRLLLDRGAPVDVVDETHCGTPVGWALYAWGNRRPRERERRSYYETVVLLVRAGSKVDPEWFDRNSERQHAASRMRSDPRMMAALRGETTPDSSPRAATPDEGADRVVQLSMKTPQDLTCAFSPDRTRVATGVVGRSVRVWNVETGECVAQLVGHTERVWGLAWSRDGQHILSGAWDNTARLWDVKTGACVRVLEGHPGFVRAVEFSSDGRRAITTGGHRDDRSVRVWDLGTGECLQVFTGHTAGAYCGLLASDGQRAVSGSRDGTVRVWDIGTGRCLRVIEAHATHVQHLAWSQDEQSVLSCSLHIRLWDLESGLCLQTFEGHTETIRMVEWSPDQRLVLSASHDRTVRIWEAASGRCMQVLEGHPTLVVGAAWAGQRRVVSCDEDAQIRIWDWSRNREIG
jgi:ankyrin repeat protein